MNYRLSNTAKEDLIRIYRYGVYKFGPTQAEQYYDRFFEYFDRISDNPYAFEAVESIRKGYRRCVCGVHPIYYRITENTVEIMTIIGRQNTQTKI